MRPSSGRCWAPSIRASSNRTSPRAIVGTFAAPAALRQSMRRIPPSVDPWAELGEREHLVQFYEDSHNLVESLEGFIGGARRPTPPGIVVPPGEHLAALDRQLAVRGIDVPAVKNSGQYVTIEAAALLEQILANGW